MMILRCVISFPFIRNTSHFYLIERIIQFLESYLPLNHQSLMIILQSQTGVIFTKSKLTQTHYLVIPSYLLISQILIILSHPFSWYLDTTVFSSTVDVTSRNEEYIYGVIISMKQIYLPDSSLFPTSHIILNGIIYPPNIWFYYKE